MQPFVAMFWLLQRVLARVPLELISAGNPLVPECSSRLLFYRTNKYVIITFGALGKKYKHTPLNILRNVSGPTLEFWMELVTMTQIHQFRP